MTNSRRVRPREIAVLRPTIRPPSTGSITRRTSVRATLVWRVTPDGFAWQGLPPGAAALPTQWLSAGTHAVGNAALLLGQA